MLRGILYIFAALFCMATANSCPGLNKMSNFNITSFLGVWYEQGNFNSMRDNLKGFPNCRTTTFSTDGSGNYQVQDKTIISYTRYNGDIQKRVLNVVGSVTVNINDPEIETVRVDQRRDYDYSYFRSYGFFVLDTDYTSYAIIATCYNVDSITILTRVKQIPNTKELLETNNKIQASLQKYGLKQCDFKFVSSECSASY